MHVVGVIGIVAGLVVAVTPRFGGLLVAGWLADIIVNLLIVGGYGDIALRDFGLLLGALTFARSRMPSPAATRPHPAAVKERWQRTRAARQLDASSALRSRRAPCA